MLPQFPARIAGFAGKPRLTRLRSRTLQHLLEEFLVAGSDCIETVAKLPVTLRLRPTDRLSVEVPFKIFK
jgi:hypothetical protein